ncbi:helix-turn-helix domain-containing protein [Acetobacter pomorum]|uniref:helix-turn-helix domain-containing protein n=1 Tax=Acetobacter pomorum TaxID=65959 RepID=UPI001288E861|nr:helix-turn-helix domain-containing protein [Acetobacter pomorum]KAA8420759.1 helix-turn-helix domain-containing protein [Acetobacter pomorum]KAA8430810.1 helix-turn-helix domain-containing protein [Acetobacter pomorum]KAA8449117.1 helix-turn-helix domain-containing protein [Acetobacter pomorum]
MSAHTNAHLSPAQAAQIADVSRWTIMRAIKSADLQAFRDNKNQWRIKTDDLNAWLSAQCAHTVHEDGDAHHMHTNAHPDPIAQDTLELVRVKAELEAEKMLRATVESDRDHWRKIAQKLAETRSRKWWFW